MKIGVKKPEDCPWRDDRDLSEVICRLRAAPPAPQNVTLKDMGGRRRVMANLKAVDNMVREVRL